MRKLEPKSAKDFDDIWIHENFLDQNLFDQIRHYLESSVDELSNNFEGRSISYKDEKFKLVGTIHYRPYRKLWDLSHCEDYWKQTNETIYDWAEKNYSKYVHPIARILFKEILKAEPFAGQQWIAVRGIFNLLKPNVALDVHTDGGAFLYDHDITDVYSATYYAKNDGEGGEFYDTRGFIHKPKENSLLVNIGNKIPHGVRASDKFRLGITMRLFRPQDLILTGNIEDLLYKPETM